MSRNALLGILLAASVGATADEVEDHVKLGLESYQGKDYRAAIDELNYAVAQIQEKLNATNATLLPEPLPGWTASEVENVSAGMAMMGGGTHMSRAYQRGNESLDISITAGSPMVAGMLAMMSNPMLMSSSPDMKPYRYKRLKGMKQHSGDQIEVTLAIAGQVMVQLRSGSPGDESVITQYLDAMDFDQIQGSLLQ